MPEDAGEDKYSARARAVLAVSRYYLGVPGYRLQGYQAMLGVPMPDATQWDQIEQVGDCAYVVFAQMEQVAAEGRPWGKSAPDTGTGADHVAHAAAPGIGEGTRRRWRTDPAFQAAYREARRAVVQQATRPAVET